MSAIRAARRQSGGFTLIELLVVMAIIATLAGLGMVGIPRIMRQADKTACKSHLSDIYQALVIYHTEHNKMPRSNGGEFVLAVWTANIVDHTKKDAEIFFCPSTGNEPPVDLEDLDVDTIDYTGPNQEGRRKALRIADMNAAEKVIICDRCPSVQDDSDLDQMHHANKGICYLALSGATDWIEASEFGGDYVIIGPESDVEAFQWMVPDEGM